MEAVAALSLACNVIQVVELGLKVASRTLELYRNGTTAEDEEMRQNMDHLTELSTSLKQSAANAQDTELETLAAECLTAANELLASLNDLNSHNTKSRRAIRALIIAVRSVHKTDAVKNSQAKLEMCRKALDTGILVKVYQRFDAARVLQTDGFQSLGLALQSLIIQLADQKAVIRDLAAKAPLITRSYFDELERQRKNNRLCQKFLASLQFPEMTSRQEQIPEAHQETFQWIFTPQGQAVGEWDNFVEWLESGNGVYWVNGKAGAGKSTLMNYIYEDPRTEEALRIWAQHDRLATPIFFLWNAGGTLQKTTVGLLRSLMFQMLDCNQQLIPPLIRAMNGPGSQILTEEDSMQPAAWTEKRLLKAIDILAQQDIVSTKICCFIDGLDEFQESLRDLVELLTKLQRNKCIKLCVSSRPEKALKDAFAASAQLRLQDLTRKDIQRYVTDELGAVSQMKKLKISNIELASEIVDTIIDIADGVFLWVKMAVRELAEGLQNEDSEAQLHKRLHSLPEELDGFYIQMLGRIQKLYRKDAALYFQVVIEEEPTLLGMAYANSQIVQKLAFQDLGLFKANKIVAMCETMRVHILTRCAGFLECVEPENDTPHNKYEIFAILSSVENGSSSSVKEEEASVLKMKHYDGITIKFLHRTARDFLTEDEKGKIFMTEHQDPISNRYPWCFYASIPRLALLDELPNQYDFKRSMRYAAEAERSTTQQQMLQALDIMLTRRFRKSSGLMTGRHWTTVVNVALSLFSSSGRSSCRPWSDLVGFAASYGLSHMVLDAVNSSEYQHNQGYQNYVLGCIMLGLYAVYPTFTRLASLPDLITTLLHNGADPSACIEAGECEIDFVRNNIAYTRAGMTCFEMFLRFLWFLFYQSDALVVTAENLLISGADTEMIVGLLEVVYAWEISGSENCSLEKLEFQRKPEKANDEGTSQLDSAKRGLHIRHYVKLELEVSAPLVLKIALGQEPGYERIQQILSERGACEEIVLRKLHLGLPGSKTWTLSPPRASVHKTIADCWLKHASMSGKERQVDWQEELKSLIVENFDLLNGVGADTWQGD